MQTFSMSLGFSGKRYLVLGRKEYANLCLIVELVTCISGSNSAVDRCFNILTQVLTDFRLKSNHNTLKTRWSLNVMTTTGLRQKESNYLQELLKYICQSVIKHLHQAMTQQQRKLQMRIYKKLRREYKAVVHSLVKIVIRYNSNAVFMDIVSEA